MTLHAVPTLIPERGGLLGTTMHNTWKIKCRKGHWRKRRHCECVTNARIWAHVVLLLDSACTSQYLHNWFYTLTQLANSFMWVGGQFLYWINFNFNAVDRIRTWGTKSELRFIYQALNLKRYGEVIWCNITFSKYFCFYKRRVKEVIKSRDVEGNIRIISLKIAFLIFQN